MTSDLFIYGELLAECFCLVEVNFFENFFSVGFLTHGRGVWLKAYVCCAPFETMCQTKFAYHSFSLVAEVIQNFEQVTVDEAK